MSRNFFIVLLLTAAGSFFVLSEDQGGTAVKANAASHATSNVHKIEELTAPQLEAFNRDKTLFILPVGTLEEHGPHLPVGMDSFSVQFRVDRVSERVGEALPDWNVVLMPPVSYGEGGANEIGGIHVHPGTYGIRQATLRSIIADVGGQIAQNRFRWVFVIHGHGGRNHNVAISEACDFVSETFKVTMLNLTSLMWADAEVNTRAGKIDAKFYTPADLASFGLDLHAGWGETSDLLLVRPDLVRPSYKRLPSLSGKSMAELRQIASAPGWPGYFSSPARASAAYGKDNAELRVEVLTNYILRAVRGENFFNRLRYPEHLPKNPATMEMNNRSLEREREFEAKLEQWLTQRKKQ
jgi:creatinine amidohydrolase